MQRLPHVTLSACPVCEGTALSPGRVPGRWIGRSVFAPCADRLGLSRCRGCGFVFVNPRPSDALLQAFYAGAAEYVCHLPDRSGAAAKKAAAQLAVIERYAPFRPGAHLLDYGCGGGYLLRHARERGWVGVGYDVGARALAACRRQRLPVVDDLQRLAGRRFDVIVLSHVFEHLSDHAATLAALRGLLAAGGKLVLEVPNARSLRARLSLPVLSRRFGFDERYRAYPIHLSYFSPRTLSALLARQGFALDGVTTTGVGLDELLLREEAAGEAGAGPSAPSPLGRLGRSLVKRILFSLHLGENLVAVAHPVAAEAAAPPQVLRSLAR